MRHFSRFAVLAGLLAAVLIGVAVADTLTTPEKTPVYRFNFTWVTAGGVTTWADSTKTVYAFPVGEDTTGNGKLCYWIGGARHLFGFHPDSTDVYQFVETTGLDSLINGMDSVLVMAVTASEGFVASSRAFGDTVIATEAIKLLAVTTGRMADLAVTTDKMANLAVTGPKIALLAIDSTKMAVGSIPASRLQENAKGRVPMSPPEADTTVTYAVRRKGDDLRYIRVDGPSSTWGTIAAGVVLLGSSEADSLSGSRAHTSYMWADTDSLVLRRVSGPSVRIVITPDSLLFYGPHRFIE